MSILYSIHSEIKLKQEKEKALLVYLDLQGIPWPESCGDCLEPVLAHVPNIVSFPVRTRGHSGHRNVGLSPESGRTGDVARTAAYSRQADSTRQFNQSRILVPRCLRVGAVHCIRSSIVRRVGRTAALAPQTDHGHQHIQDMRVADLSYSAWRESDSASSSSG